MVLNQLLQLDVLEEDLRREKLLKREKIVSRHTFALCIVNSKTLSVREKSINVKTDKLEHYSFLTNSVGQLTWRAAQCVAPHQKHTAQCVTPAACP